MWKRVRGRREIARGEQQPDPAGQLMHLTEINILLRFSIIMARER
jgi:hypothetical protein